MSKGFSWIRAKYRQKGKLLNGDTIVEVMISMVVLAVVSGTAYSLSIRAFNQSADSQYRDQAVSYSQQQVELIKEADSNKPQYISWYQPPPGGSGPASGTAFCIDPGTKAVMTGGSCLFDSKFTISITYQALTKIYKVTTSWPAIKAGENNQTVVYYKPSDSFVGNLHACPPGNTDPLCDSIQTNVPAVRVSSSPASPPSIVYGTNVTINWNYTMVQAGKCAASSSPVNSAFNGVDANSVSSFSSSTLPVGDDTFTITCKDNANNPVVGSVAVTINNPAPTVKLVATPHQLGLRFNSAGPIPGMTCKSVNESADPDTWNDNYLCWPTNENLNLSWDTAGPTNAGITNIGGNVCVNTFEGADPDTWWDNYLCSPSNYGFRWSSSGPISGMYCTQWQETADPYTWNDNYLCEPTNSAADLSWTSTGATSCSSSWGGGGSGTTGSSVVFGITAATTYSVTCSGPGGSKSDSQTVSPGGIATQPSCVGSYCAPLPPPVTQVYLCINADFDKYGQQCSYGPYGIGYNCQWVGDCGVPNDTISSMVSYNGTTNVAFYWDMNYGGSCANFSSNTGFVGSSWNDQMSSFKIGSRC